MSITPVARVDPAAEVVGADVDGDQHGGSAVGEKERLGQLGAVGSGAAGIAAAAAGDQAGGGLLGFAAQLDQLQLREHQAAERGQVVGVALVGWVVLAVRVGLHAT
jgi:hypothetical protein